MATNGEIFEGLLKSIENEVTKAGEAAYPDGDLWTAHAHLMNASRDVQDALEMLRIVSRTAFERVFKEKL